MLLHETMCGRGQQRCTQDTQGEEVEEAGIEPAWVTS